jgi:hypothetical protein
MTKTRINSDSANPNSISGSRLVNDVASQILYSPNRTIRNKLADVVSLLDFIPESEHGNIRNWTSTYDCTSALNAALSEAYAIYVPSGLYRVVGPIQIDKNLYGDGASSIYNPITDSNDTARGSVFRFTLPPAPFADKVCFRTFGGSLEGIFVDGTQTSGAIGIEVNSGTKIRNCQVSFFYGTGAKGVVIKQVVNSIIENCFFFKLQQAFYSFNTPGGFPTTLRVLNTRWGDILDEGALIEGLFQGYFENCIFESCGKEGFKATGTSTYYGSLVNCWFEDNWRFTAQPEKSTKYHATFSGGAGFYLDACIFDPGPKSIDCDFTFFMSINNCTVPFSQGPGQIRVRNGGRLYCLGNGGEHALQYIDAEPGTLCLAPVMGAVKSNSSIRYLNNLDYNGTFRLRADGTTDIVQVSSGNLVLQNAANGIGFKGDSSNLLNHYEQSNWTASISCQTGTATLSTTARTGSFVRVGNLVTAGGRIEVSSVNSPSGYFDISLPYTAAAFASGNWAATVTISSAVSSAVNSFTARVQASSQSVRVELVSGTAISAASAQQLQPGSVITFSCSYQCVD